MALNKVGSGGQPSHRCRNALLNNNNLRDCFCWSSKAKVVKTCAWRLAGAAARGTVRPGKLHWSGSRCPVLRREQAALPLRGSPAGNLRVAKIVPKLSAKSAAEPGAMLGSAVFKMPVHYKAGCVLFSFHKPHGNALCV